MKKSLCRMFKLSLTMLLCTVSTTAAPALKRYQQNLVFNQSRVSINGIGKGLRGAAKGMRAPSTLNAMVLHKRKLSKLSRPEPSIEEYFDIVTYNLDRRLDRWQALESSMSAQGLNTIRFPAIDGKQEFPTEQYMVENGYVTDEALQRNPYLTKGAVAIGMTSRLVWEYCKDSSKPYCIILQDDILIKPDFKEKLQELTSYIRDYDFDVLMLHQNVYGFWGSEDLQMNRYNAEWVEKDNHEKIVKSIMGFSAAAYIINNNSAQKLLSAYTLPLDTNADMFWWGTYTANKNILPKSHEKIFTKKVRSNAISVMQTHPLWYKNVCDTTSQCTNGDPSKKDSEVM